MFIFDMKFRRVYFPYFMGENVIEMLYNDKKKKDL